MWTDPNGQAGKGFADADGMVAKGDAPAAIDLAQPIAVGIKQGGQGFRRGTRDGHYKPKTAPRPDEPKPQAKNTEHSYEVFALAEEAAAQENYSLAEQLFERVRKADPKGLGLAAEQRLAEIRFERDRKIAYENIVRMVNTSKKGAKAAWGAFVKQYGADPDPKNLAKMFKDEPPPPPDESDSLVGASGRSPLPDPAELTRLTLKILPQPFEWCLVKGGEVVLEDASSRSGTKGGRYEVPDFLIAKYSITNAQYEIFVAAKDGYAQADWWDYSEHAMKWRKENSQPQKTGFAGDDLPRTRVSWYEAVAFCRWLDHRVGGHLRMPPASSQGQGAGGQQGVGNEQGGYTDPPLPNIPRITLPSEQQWQRAAIGDTGWVYPWGNDFDPRRCNSKESGMGKPTPVTQYPNGASPYGVFGMSGNVWEWCLTEWGGESKDIISKSRRVLRGGSWSYLDHDARAAARANRNPASRSSSYGFRVVCSAPILW